MNSLKKLTAAAAMAIAAFIPAMSPEADACSRVLYQGNDSLKIVGRSLDWKTPIPTNLYVYPRGISKLGDNKPNAVKWTSKYGAVYAVSYDGGITEGMNEKGLVVNGLFCKGTVYNGEDESGKKPISLAVFVAWLLDMNETTDEVVKVLEKHDFTIGGATFDGGTVSALHWGVTDATGKSVIFEFDHGKINIYDMKGYPAMTNDPQWPQMKGIIDYWRKIGGTHFLPGTVSSPDRCVRADFFATHVEKTGDIDLGVSISRSILEYVSVPYTYMIQGEPNVSSTQWRSYSVPRDKRYYFDIVTNPGIYYVDLNKIDLRAGQPVWKLDTSKNTAIIGEANKYMKKSPEFTPMY